MSTAVKYFSTQEQSNTALSEYFNNIIQSILQIKKPIFIALSGGTTPIKLFELIAKEYQTKIDWTKIHFFWVDERCVPMDHPESNYKMTYDSLVKHIAIPEINIHRIDGRNDPVKEVIRYTNEIKQFVPIKNELPVFDILLLGIGTDGHTASIFQNNLDLFKTKAIVAHTNHPDSKQNRITLTGTAIDNATHIIFQADKKKSQLVSSILEKKANYRIYPAAYIQPNNGELIWFVERV